MVGRVDTKLKLSEIEDIFIYLWEKEEKLFNIFLSKSTYELDFKRDGFELGETSKLISFIETFISTFEKLYQSFDNLPHTVLRKINKQTRYESHKVSVDTIEWLISNLDDIYFDTSLKGHYDSIRIGNKYGILDNINTSENENSYNNYENQIILGSFLIVLKKLSQLKFTIKANINIEPNKDDLYADFKDLKRIPFVKLFEDSTSLEKKTIKVYNRYKRLFFDVKPKIEKPILTTVFSQKLHYRKAFTLIKNLNNYKFDLFGEFKLLNISKLSKLYEVYVLYVILESIKNNLKLDLFEICAASQRSDEIIETITFNTESFRISLYYEGKFYDTSKKEQKLDLRRIDTKESGNYYNPDYIIEIFNIVNQDKKYFVFDAKYSKFHTVKSQYLPEMIGKYIINTGIYENPNKKINSLNLIFPGENGERIVDSNYYEPTVNLLASKPNFEDELIEYISYILLRHLPSALINK